MEFEAVSGAAGVYRVIRDTKADGPLFCDAQSALDLIGSARYQFGDVKLIVDKADICEDFFDLKTRLAGEVLQKFTNYQMPLAITGDFSGYRSRSLQDFIFECNKGKAVIFVADAAAAVAKWQGQAVFCSI